MTCREATEFIMEYVSGQLDLDILVRFEQHLSRCDACRKYLANYQATMAMERAAFASNTDPDGELVPEELVRVILDSRRR